MGDDVVEFAGDPPPLGGHRGAGLVVPSLFQRVRPGLFRVQRARGAPGSTEDQRYEREVTGVGGAVVGAVEEEADDEEEKHRSDADVRAVARRVRADRPRRDE